MLTMSDEGRDNRLDLAERAAQILRADGLGARVVADSGNVRVAVSRELSRGRRQEMGHVEIELDGIHVRLERRAAHVRDLLAALGGTEQ